MVAVRENSNLFFGGYYAEMQKWFVGSIPTSSTIMIKIKIIEIAGFVSALKALHLPFGKECNSVAESNGCVFEKDGCHCDWHANISEHDEKLLRKLINAGDEHAKVVRGIVAYFEINAPRFWWQEFDTYRMGCEKLASESTMHIQGKGMNEDELVEMKSNLTEGTMQKRIVMISYQTLRRIYKQRKNHRLPHWRIFCKWMVDNLPYSWMIIG